MADSLSLDALTEAVAGLAPAVRSISELQPAGGPGDKVFPPTYEGGKYAVEKRRVNGGEVDCVLLDSVQSQANRMELALLDAWRQHQLPLPVIVVDFDGAELRVPLGRISSLEAPHRLADAILRDSLVDGVTAFRKSEYAARWGAARPANATGIFELCPTALLFGMWGSPDKPGGMGAKFQRAMVSEIVGFDAVQGSRTSSRIDPLGIQLKAGPLYEAPDEGWTLKEGEARKDKNKAVKLGKDGKPSEANHGNVTPTLADGGFTISRAIQTTVLSLSALRRLRFPVNGRTDEASLDVCARTALAALGLCAATLCRESGGDLRSRCHLVPTGAAEWELLDPAGATPRTFRLTGGEAMALYRDAVAAAREAGLPWLEQPLVLTPSPQLVELVRRSQQLATAGAEEA